MSLYARWQVAAAVILICAENAMAIPYADPMPNSAPNYPMFGIGPYESKAVEVGEAESGIFYESVQATYGPTTAGGESTGVCDGTTISAAQVTKYNLACNLLHALFNLNANWSSETMNITSQPFETCCTGSACTVPKKYIHKCWSYIEKGYVMHGRVKVNANGELSRLGEWSDWAQVNPCAGSYCVMRERAAYSSSSSNLAGTYDPVLRTGEPEDACP